MSPRDKFAAAALTGILATCIGSEPPNIETAVTMAYELADEMMARRQQQPESDGFKEFAHELLACVVADAWVERQVDFGGPEGARMTAFFSISGLAKALDNLEMGTRASTLRKVRP